MNTAFWFIAQVQPVTTNSYIWLHNQSNSVVLIKHSESTSDTYMDDNLFKEQSA